jgi:tellurite resistance protein
MAFDQTLLDRIAVSLRTARASLTPDSLGDARAAGASVAAKDSILSRAAELYGAQPDAEKTPPTGFDPAAAALFEALVEGAYLVANADGEFDAEERSAFEQVVLIATNGRVGPDQLGALLADLEQLLGEDGLEKRIQVVSKTVAKPEQQREVLRVAALIGYISGGVSEVEHDAMAKLATGFGLDAAAVQRAVEEARSALGG